MNTRKYNQVIDKMIEENSNFFMVTPILISNNRVNYINFNSGTVAKLKDTDEFTLREMMKEELKAC